MGCVFYPRTAEEKQVATKLGLYDSGAGFVGSWLEAIRVADQPGFEIEDADSLYDFLTRRQSFLEDLSGDPDTGWLKKRWSLRDYQKQAIVASLTRKNLLLAYDTGLGKTLIAIGAYCVLREADPTARAVFVVLSPRRGQWLSEFFKFVNPSFLSDEDIAVVDGPKAKRVLAYEKRRAVTIAHYPSMIHDMKWNKETHQYNGPAADALRAASFVTLDEISSKTKNLFSKTSMRVRKLSRKAYIRLGLSAIPVEKNIGDLYAIMSILDGNVFGNYNAFLDKYTIWEKSRFGSRNVIDIVGSKNLKHLKKRIAHTYLFKSVDDVSEELPSYIPIPIWIELGSKERKIYEQIRWEASQARTRKQAAQAFADAKKLCLDARLTPERLVEGVENTRTEMIRELVEERFPDDPIIIFSDSRKYCELLHEEFKGQAALFVGVGKGVTHRSRDVEEEKFKSGVYRIIIGDEAMEMGANLPQAKVVINADWPWLPKSLKQRAGRARRLDSDPRPIRIVSLLARDTFEERVVARVLKRVDLFEDIFLSKTDVDMSPFQRLSIREMVDLL